MKQNIKERIHALRMTFHPNYIKAFIIPSTDPHLSEYVAPHWMSREWISGFTGSAGTAVILMDKAGLWTDSRYFLQAAKELEGSGITLYKEMLPETPSITEFLCQHLKPGESVSIDGKMFSVQQVEQMKEALAAHQLQVDIFGDPLKNIWKDRPSIRYPCGVEEERRLCFIHICTGRNSMDSQSTRKRCTLQSSHSELPVNYTG